VRLVVAISGASGVNLGIKFLKLLPQNIQAYAVISKSAKIALKYENSSALENLNNQKNITIFKNSDIAAPIASGSFKIDKMVIIPCSMNTLAKCAYGFADNLITRAFSVSLKEKKRNFIIPKRDALFFNSFRKYD
jgi:4-hydroxy-3-polyprenylbenzoate decarboxylase